MKNTKLIIFTLILIIIVLSGAKKETKKTGMVSSMCYQESANVSTACGGLNTGKYIPYYTGTMSTLGNLIDGNWNTYSLADPHSVHSYTIEYAKPYGVTPSSLWQVKSSGEFNNLSIPPECWNAYPDKLSLIIMSQGDGFGPGSSIVSWNCDDGVQLVTLDAYIFGEYYPYEEAMWWNLERDYCYGKGDWSIGCETNGYCAENICQLHKNTFFNSINNASAAKINLASANFPSCPNTNGWCTDGQYYYYHQLAYPGKEVQLESNSGTNYVYFNKYSSSVDGLDWGFANSALNALPKCTSMSTVLQAIGNWKSNSVTYPMNSLLTIIGQWKNNSC